MALKMLPQKIKPNQTMFQLEIWFEMIVFNFTITLTLLQICNTCHYLSLNKDVQKISKDVQIYQLE